MKKLKKLNEAVVNMLNTKLQQFQSQKVTHSNCVLIYQDIFTTLQEFVTEANLKIGNEALNYIAQCYYDSVLINEKHSLDPNIFSQRAQLDNIPTSELFTMAMLTTGLVDFVKPIIATIKRRS